MREVGHREITRSGLINWSPYTDLASSFLECKQQCSLIAYDSGRRPAMGTTNKAQVQALIVTTSRKDHKTLFLFMYQGRSNLNSHITAVCLY